MSPTEDSRSGRTVTAAGSVVASPCSARARTSSGPGAAATRPLTRKRPSPSADARPARCQSPPADCVSSRSAAPAGAPDPLTAIRPPGATSSSEALLSSAGAPATDSSRSAPTPDTRKSSIASAEPSVVSAATEAPGWGRAGGALVAGGGAGSGSNRGFVRRPAPAARPAARRSAARRGRGRLDLGLGLALGRRRRQHGRRLRHLLELRELAGHGCEWGERLRRLGGLLGHGPSAAARGRRLRTEARVLPAEVFLDRHGAA